MSALAVFAAFGVLSDWLLWSRNLAMPPLRLLGRAVLITLLVAMCVLTFSLIQFLYGGWLFIHSWGTRDLFLAVALIKLPFAFLALPRMPFTKFFSLVILGTALATLLYTTLLYLAPAAAGIPLRSAAVLEDEAIGAAMDIRTALEKFRTNHGGAVPAYLYGGDAGSWRGHPRADRLLQEGHLEQYPRNPLHLHRAWIPGRQEWTFSGLFLGRKTPAFERVRSVWRHLFAAQLDPRFGLQGIRLGNVLSDPALPDSRRPGDYRLGYRGVPLPGGFFYRAYDLDGDGRPESYLIGVLGAEGNPGQDVYDATADALLSMNSAGHLAPAADGQPDGVIWIAGGGLLRGYPWSDGSALVLDEAARAAFRP